MKDVARRIFRQALAAIDIRAAMERKLRRAGGLIEVAGQAFDLAKFDSVTGIAFGKAALAMAEGLSGALAPDFPPEGILVVPVAPARSPAGWRVFVGGHPIPTEESFAAGRAILDRLGRCNERTLIFFLLSGGGSALVESPLLSSVMLEDFRILNQALVTCGASIQEINAVRKHISATKGGRLAAAAPRATKITLAVSDVPPGEESALASGPTLPDPTTIEHARRVLRDFDLQERLPGAMRAALDGGDLPETPKAGDAAFDCSHFELLLSGHDLTHAAHRACESAGFMCFCDHSTNDMPVERAAEYLLGQLNVQQRDNPGHPVAVVADGEISSPVKGTGLGGRNSAFALACVEKIAGSNAAVLSAGTDGIDGNGPAAGAVADGETSARARVLGLDPHDFAERSDAFTFFSRLDDAVMTGPTGNNLRDLRILLAR